jgi:LMBR1-like membrane protein
MNWFIVPFLRYYHSSGYILPVLRLREATLILVLWYGLMGIVGIGFFVYLFLEKKLGLGDIEKLVVSLSNSFGLLLMYCFLAPGLIDLPRKLWSRKWLLDEKSNLEGEVGYLSSLQDEVYYEVENQIKIVYTIGQSSEGEDFKAHVDTIIENVPKDIIKSFPTGLEGYIPKEMYEKDLKVSPFLQ